jgi:adenine-specific DNA-methyltransferase
MNTTKHARTLAQSSLPYEEMERALGHVPTPREVVGFMMHMAAPPSHQSWAVLEPACADCRFLTAFRELYGSQHCLYGIEINPEAAQLARRYYPFLHLEVDDFLLWDTEERFDLIIGNPPYGIIGDASHYPIHVLTERKAAYKQRCHTWKGKYNLYGAFMERAVELLKPGGKLVFIIPATWLVLDDFTRLRQYLAESGKISVYYLGRAFPKRNVKAVVLRLEQGGAGLELYEGTKLMVRKPTYKGEMIRFETPESLRFERSGTPLSELFTIRFAARSTEFRRMPFVRQEPSEGYVPVLTGRNLHMNRIDYETCYSGLWMPREEAVQLRSFYGFPHIVVAHTKGSRLVAALDTRCYPWREEFHLVPKYEKFNLSGLVDYLNDERVQHYLQTLYRDLVPHLTRTMLQRVPIVL